MASSKSFLQYVLDAISLSGISYRPMMGEYLLYLDGKLFGGVYDDNLLVKKTPLNQKFNLEEKVPYPSAKPMYLVDCIDERDKLLDIIYSSVK